MHTPWFCITQDRLHEISVLGDPCHQVATGANWEPSKPHGVGPVARQDRPRDRRRRFQCLTLHCCYWTGPLRFMTAHSVCKHFHPKWSKSRSSHSINAACFTIQLINHHPAHKWRDRVDREKDMTKTELSLPSSQLQLPPPRTVTLHTTYDHECSHIHDRLVCKDFQQHVAMSLLSRVAGLHIHKKLSVGLHSDLAWGELGGADEEDGRL